MVVDFAVDSRYQWESGVRRYRDRSSGKFLSKAAIASLTQLRISQATQDLQQVGLLLLNGKINLKTWQQQTAEALKILHTQQYLLGVGGEAQIKDEDRGAIADELENQYQYLRNFATDLTKGSVSKAQFLVRLGMYAKAAKVSYFRGEKEAARRSGFDGAMRVLGDNDNHCPECVEYHARGMVPIEEAIAPGTFCSCLTSCYCSLVFGKLEDAIKKSDKGNTKGDGSANPKGDRLSLPDQINSLTPRQIKELLDDYKLDTKGNTETLKQRFIDFTSNKNATQLKNIGNYIQQVKARVK